MADRTRTVVLIGAGRMGKLIAEALPASGFELLGTYDVTSATELDVAAPAAELAIDFSNKASLPHTLAYARRTGAALLSGTTGYNDITGLILRGRTVGQQPHPGETSNTLVRLHGSVSCRHR